MDESKGNDMEKLTLYYLPSCPYCQKVLQFMDNHQIDIELKDTSRPDNKSYLLENGKKGQVPCLFIDNQPLYESNDIISYLGKRF